MILGLTGGYCAGKNAAAELLAERGWTCIDLDRLGHEALALKAREVIELLGPGVVRKVGPSSMPTAPGALPELDRRAIGALVFADPELMKRYEAIVQPAMLALLDKAIEACDIQPEARVCINAAILYKIPHAARCDTILELRAGLCTRLRRSRARDGLGMRRALERIASQKPLWIKAQRYADRRIILRNDGDRKALAAALDQALNKASSFSPSTSKLVAAENKP